MLLISALLAILSRGRGVLGRKRTAPAVLLSGRDYSPQKFVGPPWSIGWTDPLVWHRETQIIFTRSHKNPRITERALYRVGSWCRGVGELSLGWPRLSVGGASVRPRAWFPATSLKFRTTGFPQYGFKRPLLPESASAP